MVTVIGCGNTWRRDDGAGVRVVEQLLAGYGDEVPAGVRLLDAGTRGTEVMSQALGSDLLVIIDACCTGAEPGTVFKLSGSDLTADPASRFSSHGFRWDHALLLGRRLYPDEFPADVVVYLIEVADLEAGEGLSRAVRAAVDRVAGKLRSYLDRRRRMFA